MKLNKFTDICLKTLMYLAQSVQEKTSTISEMAKELQISRNHLMKVVQFMAFSEWVTTTKGKGGGVKLTHPLSYYRIGQIIQITEAHVEPSPSLVNCTHPQCALLDSCNIKNLLHDALVGFYAYLDQFTLEDALLENNSRLLFELKGVIPVVNE